MQEINATLAQQEIKDYAGLDSVNSMIKLYQESRMSLSDLHSQPRAIPSDLRASILSDERIILPPPLTESQPLYDSIVGRTSLRFYSEQTLSAEQVATMLYSASLGDRQDWPEEIEAGLDLRLLLVAWRVEGIAPAVYQYELEQHTLVAVGPAPDQKTEGTNIVLQTEFADAPVIVIITGNLAAASRRHGPWGHRQLLLRAGSAGHRLWFASLGVGLVGTVFAGFLPRAAQRIAGINGYTTASLLAYSTGYLHSQYILK